MADLAPLTAAIERGDRRTATQLTADAIEAGTPPGPILDAMTGAMAEVGRRFACGQGVYVPEMMVAARAMKESMALLQPLLTAEGIVPEHTAVVGTVKGDLHDIGKNLVAMMWRGAGLAVVDLGVNVPPERFVAAIEEHHPALIGISALLTTTMGGMADVVAAVRDAGSKVPIIVGGAPVTQEYADEIGADGFARDAATAVDVGLALIARTAPQPTATV
jgi:5-methyltetrahydrofolate--homocysteine methyltransferase